MKEGWKYCALSDCCNINYGTRVVRSKVSGSKYPVYGGGGETFRMDDYNREDCLVVARFAMSKQCTRVVKGKFFLNDSGLTVSPKEASKLLPLLVEKYLLASNDIIYSFGRGSAQRNLNMAEFRSMVFSYPESLTEQQRIVEYLDASFAEIDALKAKAAEEVANAKAMFDAALREEMTPKEGWEVKTLKEICSKIGSGATPKGGKNVYIESGVSIIRSLNVHKGFFKYEDLAHITDDAAESLKNVKLENNDVLFNITGASIARCCIVPESVLPARVNQHVSILRIKDFVLPEFLMLALNSGYHQDILLAIGEAGSTRQALTKNDLEMHRIYYPKSYSTQQRIVAKLDTLRSHLTELEQKYNLIAANCDALKQAILRETFE